MGRLSRARNLRAHSKSPRTPPGQVFFCPAALKNLVIHQVFLRFFALQDEKLPVHSAHREILNRLLCRTIIPLFPCRFNQNRRLFLATPYPAYGGSSPAPDCRTRPCPAGSGPPAPPAAPPWTPRPPPAGPPHRPRPAEQKRNVRLRRPREGLLHSVPQPGCQKDHGKPLGQRNHLRPGPVHGQRRHSLRLSDDGLNLMSHHAFPPLCRFRHPPGSPLSFQPKEGGGGWRCILDSRYRFLYFS